MVNVHEFLLLAEVTFTNEGITIIGALGGLLVTAIVGLFKLLIAAKNEQIESIKKERDRFKDVTRDALLLAEQAINEQRVKRGESPASIVEPNNGDDEPPAVEVSKGKRKSSEPKQLREAQEKLSSLKLLKLAGQ